MSQAMFRARRCSVDILVGKIIQRITRETTRGLAVLDLRVERNVDKGLGVVLWRARRWSVQSGIVNEVDGVGLLYGFGPIMEMGWLRAM